MIRIAVCDDDRDFTERMKLLIEQYFTEQDAESDIVIFNSGGDFLSENTDYNAVFLDIDMPDVGGFDIAEQISDKSNTLIVFVTTHDELVYSSLKFRPFRFIRKAYLEEELLETMEAVKKEILKLSANKKFMLQTKKGEFLLDVDNIEYIEIYTHSIQVYTVDGEILECYGSLSALEKQLNAFDFVRTHKSYLVNCRYIFSIEKNRIILDDKTEIPLSRYKIDTVKSKFKNHLRSTI
ncbi:MAG: response regulator transcription factor [Ruminococcaceae bacterium]|nr:response regulator transcription factor [Oscillospiraceae bacterium]